MAARTKFRTVTYSVTRRCRHPSGFIHKSVGYRKQILFSSFVTKSTEGLYRIVRALEVVLRRKVDVPVS